MQHYKHILLRTELYDALVLPYIDPAQGLNSAADVIVDALKLRKRGIEYANQIKHQVKL
jgi:hypothetical protein